MKQSDIPSKFSIPFANTGVKNAVPIASQISVTPGAASFTDGFPPLTFIPIAAGGIPPSGADANGILFDATAWNRWQQAGNALLWDSTFSAAIGGYPKGALVLSADSSHWWLCTADDNTTNPDASGAGWTQIGPFGNLMQLDAGSGLTIDNVGKKLNVIPQPSNTLYVFQNCL
jgi:hypothetical protein